MSKPGDSQRRSEERKERDRARNRNNYERKKVEHQSRMAAWRAANPDWNKEYGRRRRKEKYALYIVQQVRAQAKKKNVHFDISVEWVQARLDLGVCELSGLPFDFDVKKDLPSIDRRIPGGDYVESNCRLILFGLNSLLGRSGDAGIPRSLARINELRSEA